MTWVLICSHQREDLEGGRFETWAMQAGPGVLVRDVVVRFDSIVKVHSLVFIPDAILSSGDGLSTPTIVPRDGYAHGAAGQPMLTSSDSA